MTTTDSKDPDLLASPDKAMPGQSPIRIGASVDISDGLRTSLMTLQRENLASHPTGSQTQRTEIYSTIQARLASSLSFHSLVGAVEEFNEGVTQGRQNLLIDKQTHFRDLHRIAQEDLKKRFAVTTPQKKRTQIWRNIKLGLEKFCQVVYNYSSVMDVLASSHPEIASLAWGAMKFLLAVSVNDQELKERIVYHLAEIGEQFKIVDSYVRLFPEMDMVEHVCGVYDKFTTFLQVSIKWCKENALVKFFKTVALPYEARIKPTIDELNAHLKRVKDRVDVHNTHRLAVMQYDISALIEILDDSRRLQVDSHAIMAQLLQGIASDQKKQARQSLEQPAGDDRPQTKDDMVHTGLFLENEFSTSLNQTPGPQLTPELLKDYAIQSTRLEARESYVALDLLNKPEVKAWTGAKDSSLLWIDGFVNLQITKWTTEFSIDVLLGIERQNSTVLFYFGDIATKDPSNPESGHSASPKAIVHSFIIQLLRQHAYLAGIDAKWLTPQRWIEARRSTKAAWSVLHYLLKSLAAEIKVVYIVIDSIDALSSVSNHSCDLQPFLRRLSALVVSPPCRETKEPTSSIPVKILLTSVTSSVHQLLFPPTAADLPPSHSIIHIPQTYGQHNIPRPPVHLCKPSVKRLVRLPDSDDEFGLKPADSFGFSDDELANSLTFSSDEEKDGVNRPSNKQGEGKMERALGAEVKSTPHTAHKLNTAATNRHSDSSEELEFSDIEENNASKAKPYTNDIQFSSSSEEAEEA